MAPLAPHQRGHCDHLKSPKLIQMATSYSQKALLKTFWETNLDSLHRYVGCQANMYNQNVQNVKSWRATRLVLPKIAQKYQKLLGFGYFCEIHISGNTKINNSMFLTFKVIFGQKLPQKHQAIYLVALQILTLWPFSKSHDPNNLQWPSNSLLLEIKRCHYPNVIEFRMVSNGQKSFLCTVSRLEFTIRHFYNLN